MATPPEPDKLSQMPQSAITAEKTLLRLITCGSVDDGKSTLIGRMLWEKGQLPADERISLELESRAIGRAGPGKIDYSLLVDGLSAEREQGITIDVAYRYFQTERRKFIVADTPGHTQYTRNMATASSGADLAVILVDARHGIQNQTRRHTTICSLMGIRHILMVANKMDLVNFDEEQFQKIRTEFLSLTNTLNIPHVECIPMSALEGDNISVQSPNMPWYTGETFMDYLDTAEVAPSSTQTFRFPVQWVNRPNPTFRGFSGTVRGGSVRVGDAIRVWPSQTDAEITRIVTYDNDLEEAYSGDAVTLVIDREVDISRGDIITTFADDSIALVDQFQANLVWVGSEPMIPGRRYLVRLGTARTAGQVTALKYRLDMDTLSHTAARSLELNDVGVVTLMLDRALPLDRYADNRDTGSLVLIDPYTNETLAAGTIEHPLRRASNIVWHEMSVDKNMRAQIKAQTPSCIWFTGLSGSGKSTIANFLEKRLVSSGAHTYVLDGDNVRHGLNNDLGFTEADRVENIRRVAEVAKLMVDAGLIVIVCAISPYHRDREMARSLFEENEFIEVLVDTPLEECEKRDPKGLYKMARGGEIPNFTGISAPYERPEAPEVLLDGVSPLGDLVSQVIENLPT
jgi:bifunctional enzyme CysN/CysC